MIENDIERIEKKIDLFFKILLGLSVPHIGHLYNRKYIDDYIDELVSVYDLSAEKDVIDNYPTQEEIQKWEDKVIDELSKLDQDYNEGNFLAKEKNTIKTRIKNLRDKYDQRSKLPKTKEKFENKSTELYKVDLFRDLQMKLKMTEEHDNYNYRKLIRKKDDLKKETENLIKELHDFLDNNKKEEL